MLRKSGPHPSDVRFTCADCGAERWYCPWEAKKRDGKTFRCGRCTARRGGAARTAARALALGAATSGCELSVGDQPEIAASGTLRGAELRYFDTSIAEGAPK